ncbi:MAG: TIGR01212 family radical SAM protein [Peptococcaceae bacterium]|jgi:hypothetical protein|nr:MAG: TIGR01212 family radical SAM protein [Peptococcaceae bacterium]
MPVVRYNRYSDHLLKKYGEKVYKLPLNVPGTCPNRDGRLGRGGCIFCDPEGSGFECLSSAIPVRRQVEQNKVFFKKRYGAKKFISYFQAFTNTYRPLEQFRDDVRAACLDEDIVGVSISTRPDCINDRYLDCLLELKEVKSLDVVIELGLQTVNYRTLVEINRGHTLAEFIDAIGRIKSRNMEVCVHLILNLPGDDVLDVIENARVMSALGVHYVKLHSLYVVRGTVLGDRYERGELEIISMADYVDRVVKFLEYLDPAIVIQRLVGKGPKENLLFCNWGTSWWAVRQAIEECLEEKNTYQGRLFDYLNGKALKNLG